MKAEAVIAAVRENNRVFRLNTWISGFQDGFYGMGFGETISQGGDERNVGLADQGDPECHDWI